MEAQAIYRKSEKGSEAIATRGHGVVGKLRMLLILVDGKKNVDELTRIAEGMGESVTLLKLLEAEGLIELASASAPAGPASAQGAAVASGADIGRAKSLATRLLVELLGPNADDLAMRIEAAKDVPQFVEAMKRAYAVVRDVKGQAAADTFGAAIEAQMPAA
jgi:hypothetical protein